MIKEFLCAKIHRATISDANLNYVGSITIDETLMNAAGLSEYQKVDIVNINNGERFSTYVITGEKDSGIICLNGAAARKVQKDDKIIIMAYAFVNEEEIKVVKPKIVHVDDQNKINSISECE